jgi:hypothetical protein
MNAQHSYQMDANTVALFERELQHVDPIPVFKDKGLLSALEIFQLRTDIPAGAETYAYRMFDTLGKAKFVEPTATDIPAVDVEGAQYSSNIATAKLKICYSVDEVEKVALQGAVDIIGAKREGAMRLIAELHNKTFWTGDANYDINGILTDANVANAAVASTGTGSSPLWSNKTGQQIVDDLNDAIEAVITATKGQRRPDTLILDASKFHVFNTKRIADGTDETVGTAFRKQHGDIRIFQAPEILGGFTGGANGFLMMSAAPDVIRIVAPIVYDEAPVMINGFLYEQQARGKNGGAEIRFPKAIVKRYGI